MLKPVARRGRVQRGAGLVELLVGLAVGLFVVAGGLVLFAGFMDSDRRLVVETRLMQDLRAAADMVGRDIRRGGYWGNAHTAVWVPGGAASTPRNPYALVRADTCGSATAAASQPTGGSAAACYWIESDGNAVADDAERHGFEVSGGVLYAVVAGAGAVALTDAKAVNITDLRFDWSGSQTVDASNFCSKTCTSNCPTVVVREVEVTIRGTVPGDATIARQLRSNVRVRNDYFSGQCPA